MKTLKDLTPEIESKIPKYIENALDGVFDGGRYNSFCKKSAIKAVNHNYNICGYNDPLVIVAENPFEAQLLFNYLKNLFLKLNSNLNNQLNDQLGNQLDDQLRNQLGIQLYGQLRNELDDQLYDRLRNQLGNQLRNQLDNQLYNQLGIQLRNQLGNQLYNQLGIQLRNQLNDQLGNQLDDQLRNQLGIQLYGQLRNELDDQLDNQLGNQLYSQLGNQLRNQLRTYNNQYLFTLNSYSDCYYNWYEFIRKEFKIKIDSDLNELFQETFRLQRKSGIYSAIFSEELCVISKYPKRVNRDKDYNLHNTSDLAVEWASFSNETKFDNYFVNGRSIEKEFFNKANSKSFRVIEFNKIQNEDIRASIITIIKENRGEDGLIEFLGAELIDSQEVSHNSTYKEILNLYRTKERFLEACDRFGNQNNNYSWINFTCPSTNQSYLISTCPTFDSALESAKWHRPEGVPLELNYNWISAN